MSNMVSFNLCKIITAFKMMNISITPESVPVPFCNPSLMFLPQPCIIADLLSVSIN